MFFDIKDKVALVTGGASGIGLSIVKSLLNNGIKGVVIADIDYILGEKVAQDLSKEYGLLKIVFVKTDVSDIHNFERAFEATVKNFQHIDILFNNAGIVNECAWEKCIDVNLKGSLNGIMLATEKYLKSQRKGDEALIVNTSSIAGVTDIPITPVYSATKYGVVGLTRVYGNLFNISKIRSIVFCPGAVDTPLLQRCKLGKDVGLRPESTEQIDELLSTMTLQSPDFVAKEVLELVKKAPPGSIWVIEENKPAYEFIFPDKNTFEKNTLENK